MNICAYTCICEEDACWVDQYLQEAERLNLPFCILFDRCPDKLKRPFVAHPLCNGFAWQDDLTIEFTEQTKQKVFDLVASSGFYWAMAWDIDEVYDRDAPAKLQELSKQRGSEYAYGYVNWVNCWETPDQIRIDGPFAGARRVKFYNLEEYSWLFDHKITNGAKACPLGSKKPFEPTFQKRVSRFYTDLVCLHQGLMTHDLRVQHKARWDRIYTAAVGNNPYGFWDYCLQYEEYPPKIERNPYR